MFDSHYKENVPYSASKEDSDQSAVLNVDNKFINLIYLSNSLSQENTKF